jgi:glucose-6-phosphate isomerase
VPKPASSPAMTALHRHAKAMEKTDLRTLFAADAKRFSKFSLEDKGFLVDFSKQRITARTMALLFALADERGVLAHRDRMFAGEAINSTEGRAVLHVALRNRSDQSVRVDGKDIMPDIRAVLAAMAAFASKVRNGSIKGATGKRFTDVVNIGIGGSDLGPVMVALALEPYRDGPNLHFVSNVDGAHFADTAKRLNPETTLFLIASKTFTTQETMTNAMTARAFIADAIGEKAVRDHFAAISTAIPKVKAFGIAEDRIFGFWDWVGGRYSVWSAIGLPVMIGIGPKNFEAFLAGGHAMDEHFKKAVPKKNMPLILGLIAAWNRSVLGMTTHAVLPYDQRLSRFAAHLQQVDMESNGKSVQLDGKPVTGPTGPIVFGEPGTNGQHAFYQLIHQGTDVIPCDFIAAANPHEQLSDHHAKLLANVLAQSEALMRGKTADEARIELKAAGMSGAMLEALLPHKVFPGNRPSTTILYRKLDPFTLGRLLALYEHMIFVQGAVWGINSFDQWGVELGKQLANELLPVMKGEAALATSKDASTAGLVAALRRFVAKA